MDLFRKYKMLSTQLIIQQATYLKKVNVVIRGGDVIFESQSKLSTSAIALTAGTSGSEHQKILSSS